MKQPRQLSIEYPCRWGGRRKNAGRKRAHGRRRRVAHRPRAKLASRFPVHISMRVRDDVRRLRNFKLCAALRRVFVRCCDGNGFRICQFSIQGNHIHLICEATNASALARGMQRFTSMLARRINKCSGRKGAVFADRYHVEIMRTPHQIRNTLCYVINNARRHKLRMPRGYGGVDPYSSAWYFDGWSHERWRRGLSPPDDDDDDDDDDDAPVAPARTWLLAEGWQLHGKIGVTEVAAAGRSARQRS